MKPAREVIAAQPGQSLESADALLAALDAEGFTLAIKLPPGALPPHIAAEAAVDRHHAMMGRLGYERHPDFRKGLPTTPPGGTP